MNMKVCYLRKQFKKIVEEKKTFILPLPCSMALVDGKIGMSTAV